MNSKIRNKSFHRSFLYLFCTLAVAVSCTNTENHSQRKFEAASIEEVKLVRFDKDLIGCGNSTDTSCAEHLYAKYGSFYTFYMSEVLAFENLPDDSLYSRALQQLIYYKPFRELNRLTDSAFTDLSTVEKELTEAMGIYKAQFPNQTIPRFITFVSEFGFANISYENSIGIGLDMYLNRVFKSYYDALRFPDFMVRKLQPYYIAPNAVKSLAISLYEDQTGNENRFFAMMIQEGKYRYFTKALLPHVQDTIILGYTEAQLNWCRENEAEMWAHYVEKEMLYQQESARYMRYFNDGPFTVADGVPPQSAPAIGVYTGWQIVNAYMNEHPEVSLKQLMDETDYEKILKQSKYRPK
ncbi:MAG: hypothetical protein ACK45I_03195 [Bacteroidota bacterium]|jgi:hypothetical protein